MVEPAGGKEGMLSYLSPLLRSCLLFALPVLLVCTASPRVHAASVSLEWDPNTEPDLSGYKVHYGLASGNYTTHLDVGNTVIKTINTLDDCKTYYLAVTAYDSYANESGYSNEVSTATPCSTQETIATPSAPSGPTHGTTGVAYTYTTGGAVSSTGDAVQYRFSWSDGSTSAWLPAGVTSAAKSWSAPGTYTLVKAEARCSLHTSVVSQASTVITVTIAAAPAETVSQPSAPSGPTSGLAGISYSYTTGGAVSSSGDPVQYRFSWSDGSLSDWLPAAAAGATKAWSAPGTYTPVRAEARCALHQSIVSAASSAITVVIAATKEETISKPSTPAGPADGYTSITYIFSSDGARSDTGDPLVYRFHWGDGTVSEWIASGEQVLAWKSWEVPGVYLVHAEAACATHPAVGEVSAGLNVSIAQNNTLLFSDDFDDGDASGDPDWKTLSGSWSGESKSLASTSLETNSRTVVRPLKNFLAGRIDSKFKLTGSYAGVPNAGIFFSYQNAAHYRYVTVFNKKLVIGQIGDTATEKSGLKKTALQNVTVGKWYTLSVDAYPDGLVKIYLNYAATPVLSYRFADVVSGRVGYITGKSKAAYDTFKVWDETVLP